MKCMVNNKSVLTGHWVSCFGIFPIVYIWDCGFCSYVAEYLLLLEFVITSVGKQISMFWGHYCPLTWWNMIIHWHSIISQRKGIFSLKADLIPSLACYFWYHLTIDLSASLTLCQVVNLIKYPLMPRRFNPLPVQFKSLLPAQEGCVFFSGQLNTCTCHYVLLR
jgi:hypothetical protein